jgi:hypothetical protein
VLGGLRRLPNEKIHNLYASTHIFKAIKSKMRRVWHVACMRMMRNGYKILAWKPEGKKLRGRPRHRWVNIEINLKQTVVGMWTGFIWLRIWCSGGFL